jgi:hypothetical protein
VNVAVTRDGNALAVRISWPSLEPGSVSGYIPEIAWEQSMPTTQHRALARHRQRRERQGIVRLEVQVRRDDVALVRGVVGALADPAREAEARALLRERFAPTVPLDLKALLTAAPLDGVDLERDQDTGRAVEL